MDEMSGMIRTGLEIVSRHGLKYVREDDRLRTGKPWLGDLFSFSYDFFMERFVIPGKLGADMMAHTEQMRKILAEVNNQRVLELATGTGSAAGFLSSDNQYVGTDISPGLLKKAVSRFQARGFREVDFFVTGSEDLPFTDRFFDACLCVLALNFFNDLEMVLSQVKRVLKDQGLFLCCVPVPERIEHGKKVRGRLYSEAELERLFISRGFSFEAVPFDNGALLYFRAVTTGADPTSA